MDTHTIYLLSIVVIIVIFVLLIWGAIHVVGRSFSLEPFSNNEGNAANSQWIDTLVPGGMGYNCGLKSPLMKGTNMVSVSTIDSKRFPIAIETPWNWYTTQ